MEPKQCQNANKGHYYINLTGFSSIEGESRAEIGHQQSKQAFDL
jgi:hypothetical protein